MRRPEFIVQMNPADGFFVGDCDGAIKKAVFIAETELNNRIATGANQKQNL